MAAEGIPVVGAVGIHGMADGADGAVGVIRVVEVVIEPEAVDSFGVSRDLKLNGHLNEVPLEFNSNARPR
ncbi:MAG TPA: hypothetical protein VJN94_18000 [Candidatus Binataceae bacterium]|nr:hypothetical protein [Candidatus Binataceae bacterium]